MTVVTRRLRSLRMADFQDYAQAAFWYRKAADQGLVKAQSKLGLLYHNGKGVPQDDSQAALWFRKAAEKGYHPAQYGLGLMYVKGQGVPQDYTEAYFWFEVAAVGKWSAPEPKR